MAILTHLAAEKAAGSIQRSGIKAFSAGHGSPRGVFCMPGQPNFLVTHQWLRELKRRGQRTIVAIDSRLPSGEPVWVGHYGRPHQKFSVGRAISMLMRIPDALGFEIIVPRSIRPDEIVRIRTPRQVLGWRNFTNAHGKRPNCACRMCLPKGSIKSRRLRHRLDPTGEKY
jgi:hypothetical protein